MDILKILTPFIQLIFTAIIVIGAMICVKISGYILNHIKKFDKNVTLIYALKDLFKYIIYLIAIILIFSVYGIDLKGVFVSIGIVGIVVGFAAKDIISNFMSGFFLISDKSLKVGDIMSINSLKGEILKIGFRNTTIKDENGTIITIPNSVLSNTPYSRFKNQEDSKVELKIAFPYAKDIEETQEKILENISKDSQLKSNPKPHFISDGLNEDSADLTLIFWVKDISKKEQIKLKITNKIQKYIGENNE